MAGSHILIVDDDPNIRSVLAKVLSRAGHRVSIADAAMPALDILARDPAAVVLTDLRMPGMDGRDFVRRVLTGEPATMVLVLTGYGSIPETVELMRAGVFNVATKPVRVEDVLFLVDRALDELRLKQQNRELGRRLESSERMALIGKLAAGVAHELNNPLDGVARFVRLSRDSLPAGSEPREFLDSALEGLHRMSCIVKDLLSFSRNIVREAEEENLGSLLREAVGQIQALRGDRALNVVVEEPVPEVAVPRGLFQVFQNLLSNAADAVQPGGRITLRSATRADELEISVEDDGCGIPEEIRDRVFDPFFTTKDSGHGTGLGLSIVSRIMERFGGGVSLASEVGKGTTVTVFLPLSRTRAKEPANAPA